MSFLLRVASQARAVPDIPVARPKGLLPGGLPSTVPPPIEQAPPAPMHPPRPGFSPVLNAPPEGASQQPAAPAPAAPLPLAPSRAAISGKEPGGDTPLVVERRASLPAVAEESGAPAAPARARPPDAGPSAWSVPAADAKPASNLPDFQPPSPPVLAEPRGNAGPQTGPPGARLESPVALPEVATLAPDDAGTTPGEPIDPRDVALRVGPPQPSDDAPMLELEAPAPAPADRSIEEDHGRPVEVVPIAQPLTLSSPLPPAERVSPPRPAAVEKQPLLQIDQIDVLVTEPTAVPAPARSAFAAVAANRRYLRRL